MRLAIGANEATRMTQDNPEPEGRQSSGGGIEGPDFSHLIQSFWLPAMISLGRIPHPISGKTEVDLALAHYHISVLELLEKKTRGNLDPTETRELFARLDEVRLAFVQASAVKE